MNKNLVLTGMMGVGKSTIGRLVAKRLKVKFIDIDKVIERKERKSIKRIFEDRGEEYFRVLEKKITLKILKNKKAVIALGGGAFMNNQIREKIGVMFGNPETTPGGRALKFYSSLRLEIRRITTIKEGTNSVGNKVRVKVVKNKVAPPFKMAEFDIMFGEGISYIGDVLDLAVTADIVQKMGAWYSYKDEKIGQGRENTKAFLEENTKMMSKIIKQVKGFMGVSFSGDEKA